MRAIRGYYIEDEPDNVKSYKRHFKDAGIEICFDEQLLEDPSQYYDVICKKNIDFVIIDNHLDKQGVDYSGLTVLKEIRQQDSNIYILLITNYLDEIADKSILSEFDQIINKEHLLDELEGIILRIQRAYNRVKSKNAAQEIEQVLVHNTDLVDKQIIELKQINEKIEKLLED